MLAKKYTNKGYDKDGGVCIAPLNGIYKTGFRKAIRVLPNAAVPANLEKSIKVSVNVYKDSYCEKSTGDMLKVGDKMTILYTYRTSSGKKNAYISYGEGKNGYLCQYEQKI